MINFTNYALAFISEENRRGALPCLNNAYQQLIAKTGKGNDFLGWLDLPEDISQDTVSSLQTCANQLTAISEIVVVIGIGGSYLGARAVIEALENPFKKLTSQPQKTSIIFAGNSMSEDYHYHLVELLNQKDYSLIVISKSGTTTEPAIAFRILKEHCEQKYGKKNAQKRIVAITDKSRGALKKLSKEEGYQTFVIPDNVGGRYSVLTPVGLLPIAVAGFDIKELLNGAKQMRQELLTNDNFDNNLAMQYALIRYLLYNENKKMELMVSFEPKFFYFIEWYKQLFGESEGKENKGIFPAGAIFSTDLHSLGQYIQEGERRLFETVLSIEKVHHRLPVPYDERDMDGLNYLQTKTIHQINLTAEEGTRLAHIAGGVPNLKISIPQITESSLGELVYFLQFSCALGGYLLDINPFDQPGVEAYKQNMFKLLGKKS